MSRWPHLVELGLPLLDLFEFACGGPERVDQEFDSSAGVVDRGRARPKPWLVVAQFTPRVADRDSREMRLAEVSVDVADGSNQVVADDRSGEIVARLFEIAVRLLQLGKRASTPHHLVGAVAIRMRVVAVVPLLTAR